MFRGEVPHPTADMPWGPPPAPVAAQAPVAAAAGAQREEPATPVASRHSSSHDRSGWPSPPHGNQDGASRHRPHGDIERNDSTPPPSQHATPLEGGAAKVVRTDGEWRITHAWNGLTHRAARAPQGFTIALLVVLLMLLVVVVSNTLSNIGRKGKGRLVALNTVGLVVALGGCGWVGYTAYQAGRERRA